MSFVCIIPATIGTNIEERDFNPVRLSMVVTQQTDSQKLEDSTSLAITPRVAAYQAWMLCGLALGVYLLVRLIVWNNTTLLEDHDGVSYLESIKVFLTFDANQIWRLSPDTMPLYPLFGALFSLPGWSVETGARLCSLVFSVGLIFALIGIGQRFASATTIGLGIVIIAFNPSLIPLSCSVLTEPIFIAVVYLGLWLYWRQHENPAKAPGVWLGLLFGMSFLARTEGIIFLVAVPFLQLIHFLFFRRSHYDFKRLVIWTLGFVAAYVAISLPQVWRVSDLMGRFAINGRQAWELILNNPDGKPYEEKIYGLDYSPKQINLEYIQSHPETLANFESSISVREFAKTIVRNFNHLYQKQLGILIGPLGLIFFAFGTLRLLAERRFYEVFLVFAFIGITLIAPLVHDVEMRHIAIIGPLMMLIEGVGIVHVSSQLSFSVSKDREKAILRKGSVLALIGLLLICHAQPLWQTFRPPKFRYDYSPAAFEKPLSIIAKEIRSDSRRAPRIAVRKGYFTYMANAERFFIPFTDYRGLVKYCRLNDIDYLFIQDNLVEKYPFFENFKADLQEFECLHRGADEFGNAIRLYRFNKTAAATEETIMQEGLSG